MRIIHTADIHLDSPLAGVANSAQRRHELLTALANLAEYAANNGVEAVVIAGDLFDEQFTTEQTVRSVADIVQGSKAAWFVLKGNHGGSQPYTRLKQLCADINFFGDEWTTYSLGGVSICGRELGQNDYEQWGKLSLDKSAFNILVLHGDIDDASYGLIDRKAIAASNASYVALGHRHAFCPHKFGAVKGCYSGVLEARGFDETAETGFVLIDTDSGEIRFVPQAIRRVETVTVDIGSVTSDIALQKKILDAVAEISPRNYLNLTLTGEVQEDLHIDLVAQQALGGKFFALRLKDATTLRVDIDKLSQEVSLRGEFVKLASAIEDKRLRDEVLRLGLSYLSGEVKA